MGNKIALVARGTVGILPIVPRSKVKTRGLYRDDQSSRRLCNIAKMRCNIDDIANNENRGLAGYAKQLSVSWLNVENMQTQYTILI